MVTPDYGYAITTAITTVDSLPTSCTSEPQSTVVASNNGNPLETGAGAVS